MTDKNDVETIAQLVIEKIQESKNTENEARELSREERELQTVPAFRLNSNDRPIQSPYNVARVFEVFENLNTGIKLNEFNKQIYLTKPAPWSSKRYTGVWDNTQTQLALTFIDEKYRFIPKREYIESVVTTIAEKNSYHPIKERIESTIWDGTERAESYFIDLLGVADTHYSREVTRIWLSGLISRIYMDGVKFEVVPILVGGQGVGKSTATKRLLPDYHTDSLRNFGQNKDDYQLLHSSAIIEIGELKGMRRSAIEDVKNFVSATSDTFRGTYEKEPKTVNRHCVFIGTSNDKSFLKDNGVERRFYPLQCGINEPKRHPMEVNEEYFLQVLAEALIWFKKGVTLKPSKQLLDELAEIQNEYKIEDAESEIIEQILEDFKKPDEWYELSPYERRQYVLKHLREPLDDGMNLSDYSLPFGRELIDVTSPSELAYIIFDEKPTRGKGGRYTQKARDYLDNSQNWSRGEQRRLWKRGTPVKNPYYRKSIKQQ